MHRTLPVACAAAFALAACTAPQTGQPNRTASGAAIGGAVGAAIAGPVTGGGSRGALAGAAAGAAIGGLIGNQLDRQAAELERDLGDGITVSNQGDQLLVNFPQDILFATDSAAVSGSARGELQELAANLQRYPDTNVEIVGHTDNTGSAEYNFDLSTRRAGAVGQVLVGSGVATSRIVATGRGEDQPVASNLTPDGRALNRRVEVVIRPTGEI